MSSPAPIRCKAGGKVTGAHCPPKVRQVGVPMFRNRFRRRLSLAAGQSLVEFALVLPIFMLLVAAIVQFGLMFWAQNTLTQIVRDTGRWAATQPGKPCNAGGAALVAQANTIATNSSLLAYTNGEWSGTPTAFDATPPREGIQASWPIPTTPAGLVATDCPPDTNQTAWYVNIRGNHEVPLFFPVVGAFISNCNATSCSLSSSVQFRMEPAR